MFWKQYKKQIGKWVLLVLTLATVGFIFSNSVKSAPESSAQSDTVVEVVRPPAEVILPIVGVEPTRGMIVEIVRTMAHGAEFALLGCLAFLTVWLWSDKAWMRAFIPPLFGFAIAAADEAIQLTSPGRAWQFGDLMVDGAGVLCGILFAFLCILLARAIQKKRTRHKKTVNNL